MKKKKFKYKIQYLIYYQMTNFVPIVPVISILSGFLQQLLHSNKEYGNTGHL